MKSKSPTTPDPYELDDPVVLALAEFLQRTPLANGAFAPLPGVTARLVAQAVTNYSQGVVWDRERNDWVNLGHWTAGPALEDVEVKVLRNGDDQVLKLTHRVTGLSVLAEDSTAGWQELQKKVRSAAGSN